MDKRLKTNWFLYCLIVFIVSRIIMYYQFTLANYVILHNRGTFSSSMCKWDCKWYLTIINNGYDYTVRTSPKVWKGLANWAFFPLYPNLVTIVSKLTTIDPVITGILLNQIFIFIAVIFLYKLLRLNFNDLNSRFGITILIFSPFSVYFASLYTEALFIVLSVCGFYYLKARHGYTASVLGGLLSATRPVGVMFAVPVMVYYWRKQKPLKEQLIALLLCLSGLLLFMLFLQIRSGDFLAFEHIQKGWGRTGWNTAHIGRQLVNMLSDFHNSLIFTLSVLMSLLLLVKKYYEEALFNLACILPGFLTGTMMSEGRFCGTLFTFYFALVVLAEKSWTLKVLVLVLSLLLVLILFIGWLMQIF